MFTRFRRHVNPGTLIALVALVFAMSGGAYAVTSKAGGGQIVASAAKAKKGKAQALRGPRGPKGETGPAGPTGPAGLAGKEGPAGKEGKEGKPGEPGKEGKAGADGLNGKTVESEPISPNPSNTNCPQGGSKFTVGSEETFACNGQEGSPWTAGGTLPAGQMETGAWSFYKYVSKVDFELEYVYEPLSFTIPLAHDLTAIHFIAPNTTGGAGCNGGTVTKPIAEPGNLCVYAASIEGVANLLGEPNKPTFNNPAGDSTTEAGTTGEVMKFVATGEEATGQGDWAVAEQR